ncbi:MAG: hypothetical protein COX62_03100 [Deltaproteobacteria bacterium CG_4_10_14_0_2_um_filter_43_8]|nr:MAG: hypothetical protein COV43_03920 [Deltaproteobacteria bacterium CG11_big_fil_rev_8_21_14_0_20_42_23]PJA21171.1 MAG: hypothetical protein COX62_03100 [Deltaproteobacteria bacterium CG_4_10_14_0_2_um_filter_43_8]PJC63383.1 MAG: hypothetical protein CO021_09890 [Deltaproteobacteria bacterium CG_4_9_14_0_2_um_filter_42_21]
MKRIIFTICVAIVLVLSLQARGLACGESVEHLSELAPCMAPFANGAGTVAVRTGSGGSDYEDGMQLYRMMQYQNPTPPQYAPVSWGSGVYLRSFYQPYYTSTVRIRTGSGIYFTFGTGY